MRQSVEINKPKPKFQVLEKARLFKRGFETTLVLVLPRIVEFVLSLSYQHLAESTTESISSLSLKYHQINKIIERFSPFLNKFNLSPRHTLEILIGVSLSVTFTNGYILPVLTRALAEESGEIAIRILARHIIKELSEAVLESFFQVIMNEDRVIPQRQNPPIVRFHTSNKNQD
jgi:hypothetical protein